MFKMTKTAGIIKIKISGRTTIRKTTKTTGRITRKIIRNRIKTRIRTTAKTAVLINNDDLGMLQVQHPAVLIGVCELRRLRIAGREVLPARGR